MKKEGFQKLKENYNFIEKIEIFEKKLKKFIKTKKLKIMKKLEMEKVLIKFKKKEFIMKKISFFYLKNFKKHIEGYRKIMSIMKKIAFKRKSWWFFLFVSFSIKIQIRMDYSKVFITVLNKIFFKKFNEFFRQLKIFSISTKSMKKCEEYLLIYK